MLGSTHQTINPAYLGNRMKRLLAFFIDIVPISFLVIMVYRQFFEYDVMLDEFIADYDNPAVRDPFMQVQNQISMISLVIYIFYAFALEASTFQATYGKKLMGLCVVRQDGKQLDPKDALWRNLFKIVSQTVLNMGFFWILFDRNKRGWHDIIGKTLVIESEYKDAFENKLQDKEKVINVQYSNDLIEIRSIFKGNQNNLLFRPEIDFSAFEDIQNSELNSIEKIDQYAQQLIEKIEENNSEISEDVLWNNSTLGQKLLRVFTLFSTAQEEGGLHHFFLILPNYIFALKEVFKELEADEAAAILDRVFEEQGLLESDNTNNVFFFEKLTTDEWQAFQIGQSTIDAMQEFEKFLSNKNNWSNLNKKLTNYIESNYKMFV